MRFVDLIIFPFALVFVGLFLLFCWFYLACDWIVKRITKLFSRKNKV